MSKSNDNREFSRLIYRAYIRDGDGYHYGEALLLACMMHAKGKSRKSDDMKEIQRVFRDKNLDK